MIVVAGFLSGSAFTLNAQEKNMNKVTTFQQIFP